MVPPDSHRISRARCYLGNTSGRCSIFVYGALTLYGDPFQRPSTNTTFSDSPYPRQKVLDGPTTPTTQRLPAITCDRFSLIRFRSPLLTESLLFSLPVGTEMFHFPTFPPHALCVQARVTPHDWCGVPPFGHPRINARLAAPRGLSQPPTSFIGSWCPGIHRVPLTTWPHKNPTQQAPGRTPAVRAYKNSPQTRVKKMLASTVQFSTYDQPPPPRPRRTHRSADQQWYEKQEGPDKRPANPHPTQRHGPLSQDPTACLRPPPAATPLHAHHRHAVLEAGHSRRPNWSAFHPRAPPQTPAARRR